MDPFEATYQCLRQLIDFERLGIRGLLTFPSGGRCHGCLTDGELAKFKRCSGCSTVLYCSKKGSRYFLSKATSHAICSARRLTGEVV
ncbi:hypothetical protein B0H19DRAFT_1088311 [Mycena capillaripes]|nr:hypothetical protein B0H19DRAFT_1088311 [Mycena capillaripes]